MLLHVCRMWKYLNCWNVQVNNFNPVKIQWQYVSVMFCNKSINTASKCVYWIKDVIPQMFCTRCWSKFSVFLYSCLFLQRKALIVLFQYWFSAAAEEASVASRVAMYLKEVKKSTPSLLAFLINLADDNGNTVLHYSVSHCNYGIVSLLLDTGNTTVLPGLFFTKLSLQC